MKTVNYSLIRILCALVIGLALVIWTDKATSYIIITIGVAFLIPGIISLLSYWGRKKSEISMSPRFPIEGVGSALLGIVLIIMNNSFINALLFILGFILVIGGIQQIASLIMARRWSVVPAVFYLVPSFILIAGILICLKPEWIVNAAFMIIGIGCLVYSLSELINWFKFARRRPKAPSSHRDDNIEDAKIIE